MPQTLATTLRFIFHTVSGKSDCYYVPLIASERRFTRGYSTL
jgi:hypothetical protein